MVFHVLFVIQRTSVSPGQRDKYRTRTPEASDVKRRREDKLSHHVSVFFSPLHSLNYSNSIHNV